MFDSLADQIRQDEKGQTTQKERVLRYSIIGVLSVLLFSGLYLAVRLGS